MSAAGRAEYGATKKFWAGYGALLNRGLLQDRIAFVRISLSLVTACLYIAIGTYSCEARLLVPWYKTIGT